MICQASVTRVTASRLLMTGYGNIEPLQTQPEVAHSLEQIIDVGNPRLSWKWSVE
jgi:hypothetical protein